MTSSKAFVTGVTGTQGGAVARELIKHGWDVHGVTRSPGTEKAKQLEQAGVRLFQADYNDESALSTAVAGATAIFIAMSVDFSDPSAELRGAEKIIAAARQAGVKIAVVSTSFSTGKYGQFANWDSNTWWAKLLSYKKGIEKAVSEAGFESYTILRPALFMANFLEPKVGMYPGVKENYTWTSALAADSEMPMIDEVDIAKFAVAAIEDPARFNKEEIDMAWDVLRPGQIMDSLSKATGKEFRAAFHPEEEVQKHRKDNPFYTSYLAMREMGRMFDKNKTASYGIPMSTFEEYLKREAKAVKETYG